MLNPKTSDEYFFLRKGFLLTSSFFLPDCYCKNILHYLFFPKIYSQRMQKIQQKAVSGT